MTVNIHMELFERQLKVGNLSHFPTYHQMTEISEEIINFTAHASCNTHRTTLSRICSKVLRLQD